ncbi:MAG: hypothetical protein KME26_10165 [Oscillatoria princeps RMCB-10]|nr:hypothetical protein [Oscillatoria princeps RMCB-10]
MKDNPKELLFVEDEALTDEEAEAISGGAIIIGGTVFGSSAFSTSTNKISTGQFANASSAFANKYLPSWMWPAANSFWR